MLVQNLRDLSQNTLLKKKVRRAACWREAGWHTVERAESVAKGAFGSLIDGICETAALYLSALRRLQSADSETINNFQTMV